ncbi:hypothetical protein R6Y99_08175 [Pseudomonas lundensis]|uniref:hypothetical protein n=1 Tax=Serratia proteamaculans TaxID=28151 RepID=UPI0029819921|nr:hypothetical protein [Serratia proteamaculans]MDW5499765.1 hypothetical protein [Serratia proteamaculans]MDW5504830.1 hypothetical protein [Pseudomonas lundensis]
MATQENNNFIGNVGIYSKNPSNSNNYNKTVPFFGVMTSSGPIIVSHPHLSASDALEKIQSLYTQGGEGSTSDGGDNMNKRLAILESDVSHIKNDLATLKEDARKTNSVMADVKTDVAVILQKLVDIDKDLSKKPSSSEVTSAIVSATNKQIIWTIGIAMAILGLAKFLF